jgi:hypothetical protein
MEKERRRGGPVDNLREDDPETANPAGADVEKQRLGVGWRPGTTTGLAQERKQISSGLMQIFFCKQKLDNMLDNLVHILRNSGMLNFADFERHLQGYDHTLSYHVI